MNHCCWSHGLQMNHYCADACSKWITAVKTRAPEESLLRRIKLQMNHFCEDTDSCPDESLLRTCVLQKTSLAQASNNHTGTFWLHFSIVAGSKDTLPIFFYSLWLRVTGVTVNSLRYAAAQMHFNWGWIYQIIVLVNPTTSDFTHY